MNRKLVFRVGIFLAFFVGFTAFYANAQGVKITKIDDAQSVEDTTVYVKGEVDVMPEFPGGDKALMKFVSDNISYPKDARGVDKKGRKINDGMQGRVLVSFVVKKDGSISDIAVKESSGYPILDEEAIRVVKLMPKWKPGTQNGKAKNVHFTLPIVFTLD